MKARTTLKLTSASRSATRISRSASWMFSSDSRPRPPSLSKMACSLVPRESSMGRPNSTELRAEFQQLLQVLYTFWFESPMVSKIVAVAVVALALELIGAVPVRAQAGNPANPADAINNPHPAMPWAPGRRVDYGQAIRYIEVPAQYLVIMVPVRLPDGVPPRS